MERNEVLTTKEKKMTKILITVENPLRQITLEKKLQVSHSKVCCQIKKIGYKKENAPLCRQMSAKTVGKRRKRSWPMYLMLRKGRYETWITSQEKRIVSTVIQNWRNEDINSEKSLKFQKELRSCISGYRDVHKQLTNRPSSQKHITYFTVPKNKSIEIISSSDESDVELIHHRKMRSLDYDE
ncbi:uncharacterized protein TNCV_581561 [Trichonephila clavipes]|nr:uncharacterized protein TNCV_581561 [Trichonephila clavipes]